MGRTRALPALVLLATFLSLASISAAPREGALGESQTVTVDLSPFADNTGFAPRPGMASFDGAGHAYPAALLPSGGIVSLNGIQYGFLHGGPDNVVALGQTIAIPPGQYSRAHVVIASDYGETIGTLTAHYADGTVSRLTLPGPDWNRGPEVPLLASPIRFTANGLQHRLAALYTEEVPFDASRQAVALTLPITHMPRPHTASMHLFAVSLQPVMEGSALRLTDLRSTSKRLTDGARAVEGTLENIGSTWVDRRAPVTISAVGGGARTVDPATIPVLGPGEEAPFEIGVRTAGARGTALSADVTVSAGGAVASSAPVTLTAGAPTYAPTPASLQAHEAPDWYTGAKFGIFIHYGLYSIPAWAPVGGVYAEWYWHSMNQKGSPTYLHQLRTYGPRSTYDGFIRRFTASRFDPRAWVKLFAAAGARYFVFVAKHHDGFALFRTHVSRRDSVDMGPHRDLVAALFAAAKRYAPQLHRGLYYSLPEWYNPAYGGTKKHHDHFPGGPPRQFVTGRRIAYHGYIPVHDYVHDVQAPQMRELIDQYHPDLLWCDIGGPNDSLHVLAHFYNDAQARHAQVVANNRCGVGPHDFLTPEYRVYPVEVHTPWEASRGIDPHSYGYNANTPASAYMSARAIVGELVDVVSKGGNLLLDIGPEGDGSIPPLEQRRLRAVGAWLTVNGEAIYNTIPWWRQPAAGPLRFTVSPGRAFYITTLVRPGAVVTVRPPVPIRPGDRISLLGWNGGALTWARAGSALTIDVPPGAADAGRYAWTFKITWQ